MNKQCLIRAFLSTWAALLWYLWSVAEHAPQMKHAAVEFAGSHVPSGIH